MGSAAHSRCPLHLIFDVLHIAVRLGRCGTRYLGAATGIADVEGQSTLPDDDGAELPATDYPIHPRVDVAGQQLISADRKVPQAVRRERAAADGRIVADNGRLVPGSITASG